MILKYPFVKNIDPVLTGKRREIEFISQLRKTHSDPNFYGNSFNQLNQINVIQLHELGYTGNNVRILVLDSGFYLDHEVFDSLNVIATYDFVNQDTIVSNEIGDPSNQHNHGTQVLSVLAGFKPETMIGSAYGAEFLLGKTEDVSLEMPIEEDNYVIALEWGESLGADILSSSIGYIDWYSQNDLDGSTARITQAVNIAIELGMVVVTAVGNSGTGGIVAPADAFDVRFNGNMKVMHEEGQIALSNPTETLTVTYEVKHETSSAWVLVSNNGNKYPLHHSGTFQYVENVSGFTLKKESSLPTEYALSQNFPNPFNPTTTISYSIPENSEVKFTIYNLTGQKITDLVQGQVNAGIYSLNWDGTNDTGHPVSSGLYLYTVETANFRAMKKMIFMK